MARVGRDWLALRSAQAVKARGGPFQLRIEAADAKPNQRCLHSVDDPTSLSDEAVMLAVRLFVREDEGIERSFALRSIAGQKNTRRPSETAEIWAVSQREAAALLNGGRLPSTRFKIE
jgi:hypothetical protein